VRQTLLVLLLVLFCFILLPLGLMAWCGYREDRHGEGRQLHLAWADGAFVSAEEVWHDEGANAHRLSLVDPATGALLARRVLDEDLGKPTCRPVPPRLLWCRQKDELELLSAADLQTLAPWSALRALHPSLASGLSPYPPRVEPATGRLVVGTQDGFRVALDPRSRSAGQAADDESFPRLDERSSPTAGAQEIDRTYYGFDGNASTDRQALVRRTPGAHAPVRLHFDAEAGPGGGAAATYLKAVFLTPTDTRTGRPGRIEGPPGFLIAHQSLLADAQARRRITRVDLEGKPLWTVELPLGSLGAAFLDADRLVLAQRHGCEQTSALALADGRLLWTYAH